MGDLWAAMLPAAIAIALSPTGIIEMTLILFSARARVNAIVFLASVMVSVFVLPLLGASVLGVMVQSGTDAGSPSGALGWLLIGLGVLLVLFAAGNIRKPVGTTRPAVIDKIANMGPGAVFLLSLTVVWLNPINALVLISVGSQAAAVDVSTATLLLSLAVFTVLASMPFIAVAVLLVWGGERAGATLDRCRRWLADHDRIVMVTVFGLLGLILLAQGIALRLG